MADDKNNNKVISKKNSGFPDWLNFDKLRSSGIDYLGNLTGKIWTDYNVHDPGITILEALCYALLDLGYRNNLPVADLLKKDPADASPENNFFTPARILGCNPLTITDYRKLLIDIPGVKNAWLLPAEDITIESICRQQDPAGPVLLVNTRGCKKFLNGLYHVYIELENSEEGNQAAMIDAVKKALQAHRNLCEDFYDITILCKQKLGVCADIELERGADADSIYKQVVQNLRDFFSPSPKFYTLSQLLDKGKAIEDIFAGRPYDLKQSHGFVDLDEFEQIILHKEIHLSDVYHIIFDVEGVNAVRNISVRNCDRAACTENDNWKFKIFESHVPDFSLDCSGFRFTQNGIAISVNTKKYDEYFKLDFSDNGKALYQYPSPYLDAQIPYGNFRSDLADYYSIQNDFPQVYGIKEGSLPNDAPASRKAQAYQLKAYLLFFDQLLANYLSQLKNIRSLFSLDPTKTKADRHTYFINELKSVPDIDKLLRFSSGQSNDLLGTAGSILMLPVDKKTLQDLIDSGNLKNINLEKDIKSYSFPTASWRDIAANEAIQDIRFGNYPAVTVSDKNDCWFFYLFTSSDRYALISKRYYKNEQDARTAASSILYIGTDEKNYRRYINADGNSFSFDIELNVGGYLDYLQQILENDQLYTTRRESFLNHLLARFAEQFTDYAMLSFDFLSSDELAAQEIAYKEKFLSRYPDLSSNRGKGYDYIKDGWNNENISGFEKRVKALSGIDDWQKKNLCNFEVLEYDEEVYIDLSLIGYPHLLSSKKTFESRELGNSAFQSLPQLLADRRNYTTDYSSLEKLYRIDISNADQGLYFPVGFATQAEASEAIGRLYSLLSASPAEDDVRPSLYHHYLRLDNSAGEPFRRKKTPVEDALQTITVPDNLLSDINNKDAWNFLDAKTGDKELELVRDAVKTDRFIDLKGFRRNFYPADLRKDAVTYKYSVHDLKKTFLFHAENEFDSETAAIDSCNKFLFLLADETNYQIEPVNQPVQYKIKIYSQSVLLASDSAEYDSRAAAYEAATQIRDYIRLQSYSLQIETKPIQWKYQFRLAYPQKEDFIFHSINEKFNSEEAARKEAQMLHKATAGYAIMENKEKELEIRPEKNGKKAIARMSLPAAGAVADPLSAANDLFALKKSINKLLANPGKQDFSRYVRSVNANEKEIYGYRLVKKDDYHAWYIPPQDPADPDKIKQEINEVYKKYANGNNFLEICYGGDNIIPVKEETTKTTWYHYQVKSRNRFYASGGELILFESVQGYNAAEDAEAAFNQDYLSVLTKARNASSYGTYISYDEVYLTGNAPANGPVVFIPKKTMEEFGFNNDFARNSLIALANSYPVRAVKKSSAEYQQYFCCKTDAGPADTGITDCRQVNTEKDVYYFVLTDGTNDAWISQHTYSTAREALNAFYFFLLLLRYKGNYYIDYYDCDCTGRLYIREILAESVKKFDSIEKAWGKDGVERFICVSQTSNAFQAYFDNDNCRYSFYVSCTETGLVHPCKYDTPEMRDQALTELIGSARSFKLDDLFRIDDKSFSLAEFVKYVYNELDKQNPAGSKRSVCENAVALAQYLSDEQVVLPESLKKWKQKLQEYAYYFPVVKRKVSTAGADVYKFFVDLKFPGRCNDELLIEPPCNCDNRQTSEVSCCCTAWTSACCFDTCEEALKYFNEIIVCLVDAANYIPVFDCECGSYGIRFHCKCNERAQTPDPAGNDPQQPGAPGLLLHVNRTAGGLSPETHCCNDIVARNPQFYTSAKMACHAIDRAIKLINAEGLHLVEHILLRPHCVDGDCNCIIQSCGYYDCNFTWKVDVEDPCKKDEEFCFVPGEDPYSFIATAILPAWPARFRKKENRQLIENILYREAPAHVLLRILWLTPQDLCCFETYYKNWNRWLAHKKICKDNFSVCQLINFLFYRQFYCFECADCTPCPTVTVNDPCFNVLSAIDDPNAYLNQLNDAYCWQKIDCSRQIEFMPCDQVIERKNLRIQPAPERIERNALEATVVEPETGEEHDTGDDERKIDQRFTNYREKAESIYRNSGKNKNAGRVNGFLHDQAPDFKDYQKTAEAILKNEKPKAKGQHALSHEQQSVLIQQITWYYLDTAILYNKDKKELEKLEPVLETLKKKKLLPEYKHWKESEVKRIKPETDMKMIRNLFK